MRKTMATMSGAALAAVLTAGAMAQGGGEAEIDAKMREYVALWNARDPAPLIANVYRMPDNAIGTVAGLQANFDQLKAQGYSHSVLHGVRACLLAPDSGLGEMRYTRLKTDGSFMPPEMRTTVYQLKKFSDGWRITSFGAGPTNCFATAPKAG